MRHRLGNFQDISRNIVEPIPKKQSSQTEPARVSSSNKKARRLEHVLNYSQKSTKIPLLKDPDYGVYYSPCVGLSADFKTAKVFYSVLRTEDEKKRSQEALER